MKRVGIINGSRIRYMWITIMALGLVVNITYAQEITIWAENYPPYGYEENGELLGLSTDIVRYIIEDAGLQVRSWKIASWKRALEETRNTPNSVLYTVVRKPDREDLFHWIGPVSDRNVYLYKLKSRTDIRVKTLEDAKKYIVGSVPDTAATQYLESAGFELEKVPHYQLNVLKLLEGRVDLVVGTDYGLAYIAKKIGASYSEFEAAFLLDGSKQYYIVLNKDSSPAIVKAFQNSFRKFQESGELEKIRKQYLQ